jgi:TRAP-type uncharacterized transport system substrate-binding protein
VFDEGIKVWLDEALAAGLAPIALEAAEFEAMGRLGWRKVTLPKARFPTLARDIDTLDFSGWPIYANASLPDAVAYDVCGALAAREAEIPGRRERAPLPCRWGARARPRRWTVPLHPGAERWYREHS